MKENLKMKNLVDMESTKTVEISNYKFYIKRYFGNFLKGKFHGHGTVINN